MDIELARPRYKISEGVRRKVCWCCETRQTYLYFKVTRQTGLPEGVCLICLDKGCHVKVNNCKRRHVRSERIRNAKTKRAR